MDLSRRDLLRVGMGVAVAGGLGALAAPAWAASSPSVGAAGFGAAGVGAAAGPRSWPAGLPLLSTSADFTVLKPGAKGPAVAELQQGLAELGYWCAQSAATYSLTTLQAVMALQKVAGLPRTGVFDAKTAAKLTAKALPKPRSKTGRVVEVDRAKQVLMVVHSGELRVIVNTSTGARGMTTPAGKWKFARKQEGWATSMMYRPRYYNRGYAVHGSPSIPSYPASHGCSRVTPAAMDMLIAQHLVDLGDSMWVY